MRDTGAVMDDRLTKNYQAESEMVMTKAWSKGFVERGRRHWPLMAVNSVGPSPM